MRIIKAIQVEEKSELLAIVYCGDEESIGNIR